ncbi:4'-phosphopantetheinyl transferase superfamily protein [Streptomyces sp. NPDC023998]|uniref:4'-phosphopantetheinyl transferase family protein n=1 Tax=Streptomyces sp. NPDC023998 TaxID=3154597 RepID=UPI0033C6E168
MTPAVVAACETFRDQPLSLFPEEEAMVAQSVEERQREFSTARYCAREALAQLGVRPVPILPGPRGEPRWPTGIVGSMTHCAGYRAAVVAHADDVLALGIDAEPHGPLPDGVLEAVSLPRERRRLTGLVAGWPGICWDRLLFSAKESVYKAWFPLARRPLEFEDADITLDPRTMTLRAELLLPGPVSAGARITAFSGRWLARDGLVATAITVLRDTRPEAQRRLAR